MTTLYRIRTIWSGFTGAPGYTNMYFGATDPLQAGADTAATAVNTFWTAIKSALPLAVTLNVESAVALIEDTTGEQTDELTLTATPATVQGVLSERFASPAGVCVTWNTATFKEGRKVKGRTYLVPVTSSVFENNGTVDNTYRTTLQTAASALVTGPGAFVVYARHRDAQTAEESPTGKARPERMGVGALVTSAAIKDKVTVLRSRRD